MAKKKTAIKIDERQAFADQYPVNVPHWSQMEDVPIEGATLLTFGIDPSAIDSESDGTGEPVNGEQLPTGFSERIEIVKSAVRAGVLPLSAGVPERIKLTGLTGWSQKKGYCAPLAGAVPTHMTTPQRAIKGRTKPERNVEWDPVIIAAIDEFESNEGYTPNAGELWTKLHAAPPKQYAITKSGVDLTVPGLSTTLDKRRLKRRYKKIYP